MCVASVVRLIKNLSHIWQKKSSLGVRVSLANTQERNLVVAQRARAHGICSTTRYLALPARTLSSIALICDTGASSTCGRTP